jgi:hypothetical protein
MYVDNGKISARQTFRLYVFDLMGIATLLLPPYLARLCGCDGIWAILIGSGLGLGYLIYLGFILKRMGQDMVSYLYRNKNVWVCRMVFLLVGIHALWTGAFCACVFTRLMMHSLIQEASFGTILLVLVVTATYAVIGGLESRARVYEVLFWFVLIPYVAMMLASVRSFESQYVQDFFATIPKNMGKGIYLVFLMLTPLFFSLFLIGPKERNYGRGMVRTVAAAVVLTGIILLGSYVLLLGNFGAASLATMRYPVVTVMSTIQFEGNFLKRMDALMVAVWFFTLFALFNLHMHYAVKMVQLLCKKKKNSDEEKGGKIWKSVVPGVIVYVLALLMQGSETGIQTFLDYYSYVAVPLMILGPALLLLGKRRTGDEE